MFVGLLVAVVVAASAVAVAVAVVGGIDRAVADVAVADDVDGNGAVDVYVDAEVGC